MRYCVYILSASPLLTLYFLTLIYFVGAPSLYAYRRRAQCTWRKPLTLTTTKTTTTTRSPTSVAHSLRWHTPAAVVWTDSILQKHSDSTPHPHATHALLLLFFSFKSGCTRREWCTDFSCCTLIPILPAPIWTRIFSEQSLFGYKFNCTIKKWVGFRSLSLSPALFYATDLMSKEDC